MDREFYKNLKVAEYSRKSSEADDRQALSIPAQKEEAKRLSEYLGIDDSVAYEDSKSAKGPDARENFSNMMSDLKLGKRDAILCWKLNRLARNMIEGGELMHLLQKGVIKAIITPGRTYLPTDNVIAIAVEFGDANQYIINLSSDVKRGQNKKASMGIPHGLATIGFLNDKSEEKGNRKWKVDELRFPIIKQIFEMFLTGNYSGSQMYDWSLKVGLTTPRHKKIGGNPIAYSRIYTILKDTTYAGFFIQGGKRYELAKDLPRIITEDEHQKVLRMLSSRHTPRAQTHKPIYTGFIRSPFGESVGPDFKYHLTCECKYKFSRPNKTHCPKCGKDIDKIKNPKYSDYEFYYNVSRKKKKLPTKYVEQKDVTDLLISFADKFTLSPALAKWSRENIHELHDAEVESNLVVAESQKQKLQKLELKKANYRSLLADGYIETKDYEQDINKINLEIENLQKSSKIEKNWIEEADKIIDLGLEMKKILKNGTVDAKREILSKLGSNLIWDEKELFISNVKPIQILIDGLSYAKNKNTKFEPENIVDTSERNSVFEDIRPSLLRG